MTDYRWHRPESPRTLHLGGGKPRRLQGLGEAGRTAPEPLGDGREAGAVGPLAPDLPVVVEGAHGDATPLGDGGVGRLREEGVE